MAYKVMVRFQAISWDARDLDDRYTISVFGRSAEGKSVALTFWFDPYFFVKLDQKKGAPPQPWKLYEFKDLWGFSNSNKVPFYKCDFRTLQSMKRAQYALVKKGYRLYEANLDPVLRFMHRSGIESTGWIETPESCTEATDHTTDIDLFCQDWTLIRPFVTDTIAPLRVMSFDIECFSADGSFPRAQIKSNVIFQIACTTKVYGSDTQEQVCFCLGKTDGKTTCFETEAELLQAWASYLVKSDPDMITGWNIFGFDLEYIYERLGVCGSPPMDYVWGRSKEAQVELVTKELSSSALGKNILKMVPMTGRYVFDMFHTVKRDHKLEKYSLNSVSKEFLGDSKLDMPVKEIFGRFLRKDPQELGEVADYCMKDTELPLRLMDRLFVLPNMIEMARATWVPLSYLSERGQQIKVFSQICRKARELGFIVPTIPYGSSTETTKFEGATVLEPKTGAYYTPITALDFGSLYPSIMCAHNMCYSTMVMNPEFDNLAGIEYEQFGDARFAQNVPSLLPAILTELKAYRKKAKRDMALHEGTPLEQIYNSRQLAYKISMNSVYGFTGAQKGILPLVDIASSVTMKGRSMIQETKDYIEKNFPGAHVRYGDTDSVMIEFHTGLEGQAAIEESWRLGERASKECSALFKKPNELELEKVYCPYILYSKKRYAAKMFEKKGPDVLFKKIDVKGLQVVRRDSCPFVREVCSAILDEILNTTDPSKAIQYAKKAARLLLQGKVPVEKLTLSRQLGSDYKSDNLAHVAVRDRIKQRAPGSEPMQGDRVQYVITNRPGRMFEKAEDPAWVAENNIELDYAYYMKHQLENPVLELLQPVIGNRNIFDSQTKITNFILDKK
jgi:DNA polymerase delta subunit 1